MKFEHTHKPIVRIEYFSLATVVVILIATFYLMLSFSITVNESKLSEAEAEAKTKIVQDKDELKSEPKELIIPKQEESKVVKPELQPKVESKKSEIEFDIDFNGKSIRKILNYILPNFDAAEKEVGICKLNFTIKPDGSVTKIFPVEKTNTKLELNAIFAMRRWSFEPLKKTAEQVDQQAVITFLNRQK